MKSFISFTCLVLVMVAMQGCATTSRQLVILPDGRSAIVQVDQNGSVLGVAPITPQQNRDNLAVRRQVQSEQQSWWRHQENLERLDLQRERQEADISQRNIQSVTRMLESLARTRRENVSAGTNLLPSRQQTERTVPQGYRQPEVRRRDQERESYTISTPKPAPQRQKIVSSPPAQRQPRQQTTASPRQSVTRLPVAPAPTRSR